MSTVTDPLLALSMATLSYVEASFGVKIWSVVPVNFMFPFVTAPVFTRFAFSSVRTPALVSSVAAAAFVTVNGPLNVTFPLVFVSLAKFVLALRTALWPIVTPVPPAVIVPASERVPNVEGKSSAAVVVNLSPALFPSETVPAVVNAAVAALVVVPPVPLLKSAFPSLTANAFVTASAALAVKVPLIVRSLEMFAASFTVSDPPPL